LLKIQPASVQSRNEGQIYAGACLHTLIEEEAARNPQAIAVVFEGSHLTYAELNRRANLLARHLVSLGIENEKLVGIHLDRSLEMIVGVLAILKAGGAYLPLDSASPAERLAFILSDAQAEVLLTLRGLAAKLPRVCAQIVCLDEFDFSSEAGGWNLSRQAGAESLAYVIYTSGSTGQPKGCLVTHNNVVRLFLATEHWFGFDSNDVWTMFHSHAFDFSVWEIFGALLYGGRLVVVPHAVSRSPELFYQLLDSERVTVLNQTPAAFRALIRAEEIMEPPGSLALRYVIFGGEALDFQSLRPWFERHGDQTPQLVNMYGITETTVHVTYRPVVLRDLETAFGSLIGVPIPDLQVYLLDEKRQPVPDGMRGEIYVGGAGVARGYLNRQALTAERFIQNPFAGEEGGRLYRTGDLARLLPGGDLQYLGRIDQQVKIRGFRIELGEIEAALSRHPAVREAVVIARERGGNNELIAYIVSKAIVTVEELRNWLHAKLPDYMMPAAFVRMDAFPLTQNGKVDRHALPGPKSSLSENFPASWTELERTIATVWREVLGDAAEIGANDNFFDVGGNSLRMTEANTKLVRAIGRPLSVTTMFQYPTISGLARHLSLNDQPALSRIDERARQQRAAVARNQLNNPR
jgi:amino acid adenylation domain-containing protein